MPSPYNLQALTRMNRGPCIVRGCPNDRDTGSASHLCQHHRRRLRNFGDPEGSYYRPKQYRHLTIATCKLIQRNQETHPGTQFALAYMLKIKDGSCWQVGSPMQKYSYCIQAAGIESFDMLAACIGLTRFRQTEPPFIMKKEKAFHFHLGTVVLVELAHAGRIIGRPVPYQDKITVGRMIAKNIGVYMLSTSAALGKAMDERAQFRSALTAELEGYSAKGMALLLGVNVRTFQRWVAEDGIEKAIQKAIIKREKEESIDKSRN